MKVHAEKLKEKFNYALKEANDEKLDQKEGKYQVLNAQEWMVKTILKPSTLKSSTPFHMQKMIEEHDKGLNAAKENDTTETIEELKKLRQIIEYKKLILWKLVGSKTCLWYLIKRMKNQKNMTKPSKYYKKTWN